MTVYLVLRVLNVALGVALVVYLAATARRWKARLEQLRLSSAGEDVEQLKLIGYALAIYLGVNTYASIETVVKGIPGGFRTWLITLSLLTLLAAFAWPQIRPRIDRIRSRKSRR